MRSTSTRWGWGSFVLLAIVLLLAAGTAVAQEAATGPAVGVVIIGGTTCTCYWDRDCPGDNGDCTGYGKCDVSGKLDGTCKETATIEPRTELSSTPGLRLAVPQPADRGRVAEVLDLYFAAYAVTVDAGTGRPDADLLATAQSIDLGARHSERHLAIQEAVHEALDATLGFDFVLPRIYGDVYGGAVYGIDFNQFANVRIVPEGAGDLVAAVREGLGAALADADPAAVGAPLAAFWEAHPHYQPYHTGRYYPHGHAGESHDVSHQQIDAVERIAERLIDLR